MIVSAYRADPNGIDSGSSYVVFGKAAAFDATVDLSSLDGNNGFRLDGEEEGDTSGRLVSNAGDINGDGFDDVIVGSAFAGDYNAGSSHVVFGKAAGFGATLDLSSLDGSNGFRLDGTPYDFSSKSISSAGDINGDGFDDVIIGGQGIHNVVFGKTSGFDATLDLSSLDGNNGFHLDGGSYDGAGGPVSSVGDVNGDGFDDVIIGAYGADPNGDDSGFSYVVFGKASGFDATFDLSTGLDGINGFRLDGVAAFDSSGGSVSSAGDVNGDGFDDLLVGASGADPNGESSGSSYVVFGRSDFRGGGGLPEILGTSGDDVLRDTPVAERFEAGDGNDRMIGRGGADVFHGGAGDDNIKVADLGFGLVDRGTDDDALHLTGSDLNLDLASLGDKISGIETICVQGRGDNTLILTAEDVLNLSDTTNTLKVHGNAGDRIVGLDSGWTDGGIGPNGYFHTFTQGDAVLLVGLNVTTDFV